jgi:hypothetical protein
MLSLVLRARDCTHIQALFELWLGLGFSDCLRVQATSCSALAKVCRGVQKGCTRKKRKRAWAQVISPAGAQQVNLFQHALKSPIYAGVATSK